jgi:8-oxo-dGTP pyrophosphatase MutT (NUDIX family)
MSENDRNEFQTIKGAPIETVKVENIGGNTYVNVYMDTVRFKDGKEGTHLRVYEPGHGAVVVVVDQSGRLYIHEVFHYSANAFCLEFIRGYGEPREIAKKTAIRELEEEATFEYSIKGAPTLVGYVRPNTTILMSRIPIYLVRVVLHGEEKLPKDKIESPRRGCWKTMTEIEADIKDGKIEDAFTLSAYVLIRIKGMI